MINISGEPSLGTVVLTRDGSLKYTYLLPAGMLFPSGTTGILVFTDRAGGVYEAPFEAVADADNKRMEWVIRPADLNSIPAGANFEVYVYLPDDDGPLPYKVRYGRVARKEAEFPLSPILSYAPPLMYEDTLQRSQPGPRWVVKSGRLGMHDGRASAFDYSMAARNNVQLFGPGVSVFATAAALWYAPTQGDSIELTAGILDGGDGDTTVVLSSNYAMTSFMGVRFRDAGALNGPDRVEIVTGSAWNNLAVQGGAFNHIVPDGGNYYTIRYNNNTRVLTVSINGGSNVLSWNDTSAIVPHGAGFRYTGMVYNASLLDTGPRLFYWKVKDTV